MNMPKQKAAMVAHMDHVDYPASKQNLVEACNKMSGISDEDKKWFMENLPEGSYDNADDVKTALSM